MIPFLSQVFASAHRSGGLYPERSPAEFLAAGTREIVAMFSENYIFFSSTDLLDSSIIIYKYTANLAD
jgi:hypothetical protein